MVSLRCAGRARYGTAGTERKLAIITTLSDTQSRPGTDKRHPLPADQTGRSFARQDHNDQPRRPRAQIWSINPLVFVRLCRIAANKTTQRPVICAVNGGGGRRGATLALGCDMVIAARSASFGMAFSKLGLVPDCGGTLAAAARDRTRPRHGAGIAGR